MEEVTTQEVTTEKTERHSPLVSIVVLAYNQLHYTKLCIESLFRHTSHIDFELITVNNGSTDGTKEYFDLLPNEKKVNFADNIGVDTAVNSGFKLAEGKYTINVSNDLILTEKWLDNLLLCMESDQKIGMVVPASSYSSNYQQVNLGYTDLDDMQVKAKEFNKSDPHKWEDRLRLITYTCLIRTDLQKELGGFDEDFNPGGFDDDALSFAVRRKGYRLILAMDTFVHHFGSVTFQVEYEKHNLLIRNRLLFASKFGVDAWAACQINFELLKLANVNKSINKDGSVRILGIGDTCGATPLQLKNQLRAAGVDNVELSYISHFQQNITDLQTICQKCYYINDPWEFISKDASEAGQYDYIMLERDVMKINDYDKYALALTDYLNPGGQLLFSASNSEAAAMIVKAIGPERSCQLAHTGNGQYTLINKIISTL